MPPASIKITKEKTVLPQYTQPSTSAAAAQREELEWDLLINQTSTIPAPRAEV